MRKNILLASLLVLATTGPALAGGKDGSIGVGAEYGLNGITGGASVNYDAGLFHVGGFLGFLDGGRNDDTDYTFGARFYWHLHETPQSDFGVGGMVGFYSMDRNNMFMDRQSLLYFEPGIQIRAFISNNVALSFTAGISFALADADGGALNGQVMAAGGVHYYFFQ